MVELVYKFDEKSDHECLKGESIAKLQFKIFYVHKHIIWTPVERGFRERIEIERKGTKGN